MIHSAVFKHRGISIAENTLTFDGDTGKSVTLRELVLKRAENEFGRYYEEDTSISDSISQENWQILKSKVEDLKYEKYDDEFLPPSNFAFEKIKYWLRYANNFFGYEMSIPSFIVPDGEGGIRIEWKNDRKHLRVSLSEERIYLYFEDGSDYDVIENFAAEQLIEKLRWLNQ